MIARRHPTADVWAAQQPPPDLRRAIPLRRPTGRRILAGSGASSGNRLLLLSMLLFSAVPGHAQTGLEPIQILRFERVHETVRLEWVGGAAPYRVQMCSNVAAGWVDLPETNLQPFSIISAPEPFMLFRVRTDSDSLPPGTPEGLTVRAALCDRVALSWDVAVDNEAGTGVGSYNLYRDGVPFLSVPSSQHQLLATGLIPGTRYQFSISATDIAGNESARSPPVPFITPACVQANTNEAGSIPEVWLAWDPNEATDIAGYLVHWGVEPGVYPWQLDAMQDTSVSIADLEPGVVYFFTITAYNVEGIESEPGAELVIIAPLAPDSG